MFSPAPRREATWDEDASSQGYQISPSRARTLLLSPRAFVTPSRSLQRRLRPLNKTLRAATKLDIISYLPCEIAVTIFELLSPTDLCSVCQVSKRWNALSRLGALDRTRKRFLKQAREKYSENKENTPRSPTPRLARRSLTATISPLTSIQPPPPPRTRTPSPGPPTEGVDNLAICDQDVRRCLFPWQPPPPVGTECTDTIGKKANKNRLKRL